MDTQNEKKLKANQKKVSYAAIRVRRELKRLIDSGLDRINKKSFGRKIRTEDYLALALTLVTDRHVAELQEASLSHGDRLERAYRDHVTQHGQVSRDEYLGMRLSGQIAAEMAAH